jgi:phosphoserine phosphatase
MAQHERILLVNNQRSRRACRTMNTQYSEMPMSFDVICFDCDSTLSKIEGIDELAKWAGVGEEMAKLTDLAMNGELPLEAVYAKRLETIKPDKASIERLAEVYIAEIVDGSKEVFSTLLKHGKDVHIISGGLRQAILPLAKVLGLPEQNVHAVDIVFNADGSYQSYDESHPLTRSGGKHEICKQLLQGKSSLAMIGDGKTDMEAKQPGVTVIGFGGVCDRVVVRELADQFVDDVDLTAVLPLIDSRLG